VGKEKSKQQYPYIIISYLPSRCPINKKQHLQLSAVYSVLKHPYILSLSITANVGSQGRLYEFILLVGNCHRQKCSISFKISHMRSVANSHLSSRAYLWQRLLS